MNYLERLSKNTQISNLMNIRPVGANVKFRENLSSGGRVVPCGRANMTKLIVAFRSSANAPKINDFKCGMWSVEEHSV